MSSKAFFLIYLLFELSYLYVNASSVGEAFTISTFIDNLLTVKTGLEQYASIPYADSQHVVQVDDEIYLDTERFNAYAPIIQVIDYYYKFIKENKFTRILEVGPGNATMSNLTTHVIDHQLEKWGIQGVVAWNIDMGVEPIPVEDNYFDFVFCRHVLEDLNNPMQAFAELKRVAKNGYIETPSPQIESLLIGPWNKPRLHKARGWHHHRFLLWSDWTTNTLYALPKYPIIDFIQPQNGSVFGHRDTERQAVELCSSYSNLWNNYYSWIDANTSASTAKYISGANTNVAFKELKPDVDFEFDHLDVQGGYATALRMGMVASIGYSVNYFTTNIVAN